MNIGLTGGIGSGKSTAAQFFSEYGITCIEADDIAHALVDPKRPFLETIIQHFGPQFLNNEGTLNRRALRQYIFSNDNARQWLENFMHPLIREEMKKQAEDSTSPYTILVIPLLAESKTPYTFLDRVLVVTSETSTRQTRTMTRDDINQKEYEQVTAAQAQDAARCALADDFLHNNGNLQELKSAVKQLHQHYLMLLDQQN